MLTKALKFLAKDSAIYGIAGSLQKLLVLFTLPIVSRYLTKEEFGILHTVTPYALVFTGLITMGQDSAIARWFYDKSKKEDEEEHRKNIATTGFLIQLVGAIIFSLLIYFFGDSFSSLAFNEQAKFSSMWKIAVIAAPASAFMLFSTNIFKWTFKRSKYLFITISNSLINAGLIILFVYLDYGLKGIVIAPVLSSVSFALIGLIMTRGFIDFSKLRELVHMKSMFKYGIPFGLVLIAGTLVPNLDRLFLVRFVSEAELGEFTLAVKIATIFVLVNRAFQISFGPYSFSIWNESYAPKLYAQISIIYFTGLIFFSLVLASLSDVLVLIVGSKKYVAAAAFIPWLLFANVVDGMKSFTNVGIEFSKKSYFHIGLLSVTILISLVVNWLMIPSVGVWGAIIALNVALIVRSILALFLSKKFYHIDFPYIKFFVIAIFAFISYWVINSSFLNGNEMMAYIRYFIPIFFLVFIYVFVIPSTYKRDLIVFIESKRTSKRK